ncbi:MAG: ATP-binding cassette domain-containing protein [Ignavibacteria bacterium]|nr:ATP-binding cassette domain-containing protein [Ignavibacteria bacterium]
MIEVINLHKSFGEKKVLNGITLTIPDGVTYCIIGRSGCGKSVLIKNIVGLLDPDEGEVIIDGQNIHNLEKDELFRVREKFGFVFQGSALFDSYTVYENVVIGLYERGIRDEKFLVKEAIRTLSAVGLLPKPEEVGTKEFESEWKILKDKMPADLSGGMKKRVAVARALVGNPSYIFYDEPTTGLDPVTSEQVDNLIVELAKKFSITSIIITHDLFSVFKIANYVAMIDDGNLVFDGEVEKLRYSQEPVVREFLERYKTKVV